MELPKGGKCVFSPDSRYAQVGDRYGDSRSLLEIESGDLLDFKWAKRWAFSPNSRYAVGGSGRNWFFIDLATRERTEIRVRSTEPACRLSQQPNWTCRIRGADSFASTKETSRCST